MKQYNAKAHLLEQMQRKASSTKSIQAITPNGVRNLKTELGRQDFLQK
jgi:hypothetical protein